MLHDFIVFDISTLFFLQMEALLNQENLNHCVKKSVCALLLFFSSKDIIKHF